MAAAIQLKLKRLRFPSAAGQAQANDDTSGLIAALGNDYESYHDFLAKRWADLGEEPDPKNYKDDFDGYANACDAFLEVLFAERFLRQSQKMITRGASGIDLDDTSGPPLLDSRQRLVSASTGKPESGMRGMKPRKPALCPFADGDVPPNTQ